MKTQSFEFEKRAMLTHEQYIDIVSFILRKYSPKLLYKHLLNEYFDTESLDLLNSGCVLRVRHTIHDGMILTLKSPLEDKSGDLETSQHLSLADYDSLKNTFLFPDGPVKDKLIQLNFSLSQIKYMSSLKCKRTEIEDGEYVIVLDENNYDDIFDYNIEIEASSLEAAQEKILEYSKMFNFEIKDNYVSKSRRVLLNKTTNL